MTSWRCRLDPAQPSVEDAAVGFRDPSWCLGLNGASLACGFIGNFFLLCNFTRRIRYIVALPMTIILWYFATGIVSWVFWSLHTDIGGFSCVLVGLESVMNQTALIYSRRCLFSRLRCSFVCHYQSLTILDCAEFVTGTLNEHLACRRPTQFHVALADNLQLIGITAAMHKYVPPKPPLELYSQGYWHAVIAGILYMISSMLLMLNMMGYFLGHYPQHFELSEEQRNLILQTMMFFIWLAGGAGIFARVDGWSYTDAVSLSILVSN